MKERCCGPVVNERMGWPDGLVNGCMCVPAFCFVMELPGTIGNSPNVGVF